MTSIAVEILKKARTTWPDVVDNAFIRKFLDDGEITPSEAKELGLGDD